MMYKITLSLLMIALLGCQDNKNVITKSKILTLFSEVKALYLAGNIDEMMPYYTDDIIVMAHIKKPSPIANATIDLTLKFSKEKYKALLTSVLGNATSHTYNIEDLNINIGEDAASTFASYTATERVEAEGEVVTSKSFVKLSFIITVKGKLLIASMDVTELERS